MNFDARERERTRYKRRSAFAESGVEKFGVVQGEKVEKVLAKVAPASPTSLSLVYFEIKSKQRGPGSPRGSDTAYELRFW